MRLYEVEAKRLLATVGIPSPAALGLVDSRDALAAIDPARFPVMVKAQVLVGGRAKAGGVVRVGQPDALPAAVEQMLALRIGGAAVRQVLIEEAVGGASELLLAVVFDPASANVVIVASTSGGVDVEQAAATAPDTVLRVELEDCPETLAPERASEIGRFLARGDADDAERLAAVASRLYLAYHRHDLRLAEINPLLLTPAGPLCGDAKVSLDDNALYRQQRVLDLLGVEGPRHEVAELTTRERRAWRAEVRYLDLLDEDAQRQPDKIYVGLVAGGAGYGIFAIDELEHLGQSFFGGRVEPLNFMDSGGGPPQWAVSEMFGLLMDHPLVDLIITSRFGGISSCDLYIRGLVDCLRRRAAAGQPVVPVYGRMVGTDLPAARAFLETARAETPQALAPLTMEVGNAKIMADVMREALADFTSSKKRVGR